VFETVKRPQKLFQSQCARYKFRDKFRRNVGVHLWGRRVASKIALLQFLPRQ